MAPVEPNAYQGRCAVCGAYVMARKGFWDGSRTLCEEHARSGPTRMPEARVQICLMDGAAIPLAVSHLGREGYQRFASACAAVGVHFRHGRRTADLDTVPRLMASLERSGFLVEVLPELSVALHARAVEVRRSVEEASKRADRADRKLRERGKALYEFQFKGVDRLAQSKSLVLGDSPGLGKGGTLSTKILTPTGWTTFGRIKVGDKVVGADGKPCLVTGVYPRGKLPVFKVRFSDGSQTTCDEDHLWPTWTKYARKRGAPPTVVSLRGLRAAGIKDLHGRRRFYVPLVEPVEFDARPLPLDPYVLGVILGDGSIVYHGVSFTKDDECVAREVAARLPSSVLMTRRKAKEGTKCWGISNPNGPGNGPEHENDVTTALRRLGLMGRKSPDKFVPDDYLFNSVANRVDLFHGLMDTDGYVEGGCHLAFCSTSRNMAESVKFLVQSFGGTARISTKKPRYTYKGEVKEGKTAYVVSISPPSWLSPFKSSLKSSAWRPAGKYGPMRLIEDVEPAGAEDVVCISVDAPDRLYVTDDFIVTHNTIQALVATPPEGRLLVIAPAIMKGAIIDGAPRGGWAQAARTWRPEFAVTILSGRASFRWPREGEVVITNYDIMPPTHEQVAMAVEKKRKAAKKAGEAFDEAEAARLVVEALGAPAEAPEGPVTIAADEAHMCTKPDSLRTQRYRRLSRLALESGGASWALTGTPLMNKPEELWCLLDCLGVAVSTFGSWANYMRLYDAVRAQVAERRWEIVWGPPSPEVAERLRAAMLRREKRDVLKDLPERQTQTIVVPIDKSTLKLCDEALKVLSDAGIDLEKAIELAESAKDKIAFPIMSKVRMALAQAKAPGMIELAEQYESAETPVLFLSVHLVVPELMQKRKGWGTIVGDGGTICVDGKSVEKVQKSEVVLRLLKGEINNVAGTIGAMGTGVDGLQERISHGVFVDEAWTPGANEQAVSRLERIGAQNRIMITRVIGDHPLDYRVAEVIARKVRLFDETIVRAADRPWDPVPDFDLAAELDKAASRVPPPWGTTGGTRR